MLYTIFGLNFVHYEQKHSYIIRKAFPTISARLFENTTLKKATCLTRDTNDNHMASMDYLK
jgi:hypothetical protein